MGDHEWELLSDAAGVMAYGLNESQFLVSDRSRKLDTSPTAAINCEAVFEKGVILDRAFEQKNRPR